MAEQKPPSKDSIKHLNNGWNAVNAAMNHLLAELDEAGRSAVVHRRIRDLHETLGGVREKLDDLIDERVAEPTAEGDARG